MGYAGYDCGGGGGGGGNVISFGWWSIGDGRAHVRSYHLYAGFRCVLCELVRGSSASTGGIIGWSCFRGGESVCLGDISNAGTNAGIDDRNCIFQDSEPG